MIFWSRFVKQTCARFVHIVCRFDKIKATFSGLRWILDSRANLSLVQIKLIYDYYSSKRINPFFIVEEELLEYDFQTLERIVREVPHLGEITSLSSTPLRMTKNDENNEVDLSPAYVPFQLKEILSHIYIWIAISSGSWDWSLWSERESTAKAAKTFILLGRGTLCENIVTVKG